MEIASTEFIKKILSLLLIKILIETFIFNTDLKLLVYLINVLKIS